MAQLQCQLEDNTFKILKAMHQGPEYGVVSPRAGVQWSNTSKRKVRRASLINIPNGHFYIFYFLDPFEREKRIGS